MSYLRVIQTTFLIYVAIPGFANGFIKLGLDDMLLKLNNSKLNFKLSAVEEKWFEQPLDHFDSNEKRTYKMKYFQNLDIWQTNGPIYIYIGGEGSTNSLFIDEDSTLIGQLAKDTNGALFTTEHRYYGDSLPDIPKDDDYIKYYKFLSSQQALADIAKFITFLKSDPKYQLSKVVVVGGSYSGNLAAWMRELYPDLVDAAVAASAPVLAQKDFYEYFDIIRYTFVKYGGQNCLDGIGRNFKRYEELLQSADGIKKLKNKLNICPYNDLTVLENQQFLFYIIYEELKTIAHSKSAISNICGTKYDKESTLQLNTFKQIASDDSCEDVDFSKAVKDTYPWVYQYCNEFGYLQTTTAEKQPFVHWNPLEFLLKFCKYVVKGDIEKKMDEGVARTNKMYGGITPNVSKVVFTHGDMDPWRALGVQHDLSPDAPATVVNGTSHCEVLFVHPDEEEELTKNREYVKTLIKKWIGL